jgi:hypothetical protein
VRHQKQHAIGIAMYQTRYWAVAVFTQWIVHLAWRTDVFAAYGYHGAA